MNRSERNTVAIIAAVFSAFTLVLSIVGIVIASQDDGGGGGGGSSGPTTIQANLSEFAIGLNPVSVSAGDVTVDISNIGTMAHNLQLKGTERVSQTIQPSGRDSLSLGNLSEGSYELYCNIPGHADSGMRTTLTVGAAGTASVAAAADMHDPGEAAMDPEEMDRLMDRVALEFPAQTEGHGGDLMEPEILADGTKQYDVTATVVDWEVEPGKIVKAWTYNGVVPAPMIKVDVGDKVRIVLHNELPESTTIHFHGVRVPNSMDGVPPYTQPLVKPGETFVYEFTTLEPAVGIYHSHNDAQIQVPNGLFGAFLIGDMPLPEQLKDLNVVKEINMVLNDAGTIGLSLNGKSFPATEPYTLKVGETIMVHYLNEGLQAHPMHMHQPMGWIIAKDGIPLETPIPGDTINVAPGERYTVVYEAKDVGVWAWHCHILNHAEGPQGMFGMVTALIVTEE